MTRLFSIRRRFFCSVIVMIWIFSGYSVSAQRVFRIPSSTDTLAVPNVSTFFTGKRPLNIYSLGISTLGVSYGVVALHQSGLKVLNRSTRAEILEDHPGFKTNMDDYLKWGPALLGIGLNIAGIQGGNSPGDEALVYGLSSLLMVGSAFGLKHLRLEQRPDHSNFFSFPSGHTAAAFAAAEWLRTEYWQRSPWIGVAGYAMAATTGILRIYNNKHWVSDVIAGAAIGFLCTRIAYWINPWIKKHILHADRNESFNN